MAECLDALSAAAARLDARLGSLPLDRLAEYLQSLRAYNEHTNLVGSSDWRSLALDHVLDSLSLVPVLLDLAGDLLSGQSEPPAASVVRLVDIGSGAGFPALVLAMVLPQWEFLLIESLGKKARFLSQEVERLALSERVRVEARRAEDLVREPGFREHFQFCTARAVAPLNVLLEYAFPFLCVGGCLVAQKSSAQVESEMRAAAPALAQLGGSSLRSLPLDQTVLGRQVVAVLATKCGHTDARYPRPTAQIKRKPLGL